MAFLSASEVRKVSRVSNPLEGESGGSAERRMRPSYPVLLIAVIVMVGLVIGVLAGLVVAASPQYRIAVSLSAGVFAILWLGSITGAIHYNDEANRSRLEAAHFREETQRLTAESEMLRDEADRATRIAQATSADAESRVASANDTVSRLARESRQNESRRVAALAAFAGAAGRMQAMTTSMLAELREMEHRHADPAVLADLLHLDHRTSQTGRLADSIAVLSGARSGRRWSKPIGMESILRGAMGRVAGYQRVRLRAVADIAIAGHAAEGVMHALAELLDNACNFSPPTTEVHVYAAEVPAGIVVTIEDSGLVMGESALRRAEQAVLNDPRQRGRARASDLSTLTGTRLGLAVVGHLARKHGLTVSFRPSAIGGTAVVIVVPRDLTTRQVHASTLPGTHSILDARTAPRTTGTMAVAPASTATIPTRTAASPVRAEVGTSEQQAADTGAAAGTSTGGEVSATAPTAVDVAGASPGGDSGPALPKRRRGSTLAAVHPDGLAKPSTTNTPTTPVAPSSLAAFRRAVSPRDEDDGDDDSPQPPQSLAVETER